MDYQIVFIYYFIILLLSKEHIRLFQDTVLALLGYLLMRNFTVDFDVAVASLVGLTFLFKSTSRQRRFLGGTYLFTRMHYG